MKVGDLLPVIRKQLKLDGVAQNLATADSVIFRLINQDTGAIVIEAEATLEDDAAQGWASYLWQAGDTDVAGHFRYEFVATYAEAPLTFPNDGTVYPWTIYGNTPTTTPLKKMIRMIRSLIDDDDLDVKRVEDAQIVAAIEVVLLEDDFQGYEVHGNVISPVIEESSIYARIIYKTAKRFVAKLTRYSYRTRGFAEAVGLPQDLIMDIFQQVYELDNGDMCG